MKRRVVVGIACAAVVVLAVGVVVTRRSSGTTTGSATTSDPIVTAAAASSPSSTVPPSVARGDLNAAAATALRWVASSGELLAMGPIRRHDVLAVAVSSAALSAMAANLERDLGRLADRLPIPASELRLIEVPLTVDATVGIEGSADVRVWSVVCFGADGLGPPRVVWRTSHLTLVWRTRRGSWPTSRRPRDRAPQPAMGCRPSGPSSPP
jgi:hypothetical protein